MSIGAPDMKPYFIENSFDTELFYIALDRMFFPGKLKKFKIILVLHVKPSPPTIPLAVFVRNILFSHCPSVFWSFTFWSLLGITYIHCF